MILHFSPQKSSATTQIEVIDENSIAIDGSLYVIDSNFVRVNTTDSILGGWRDADEALNLTILYRYSPESDHYDVGSPYDESYPSVTLEPTGRTFTGPVIRVTGQTADDVAAKQAADQVVSLKSQLSALDSVIPRSVEDLYSATKTPFYKSVQDAVDKKNELREKIRKLSK